jgi:hypothetical protein
MYVLFILLQHRSTELDDSHKTITLTLCGHHLLANLLAVLNNFTITVKFQRHEPTTLTYGQVTSGILKYCHFTVNNKVTHHNEGC